MEQQNESTSNATKSEAFQYLKTLPRYKHKRIKSGVIDSDIAKGYTDTFRATTDPLTIPVSWSLDKEAITNLLGITSYTGYSAINGIRFYAGINDNNQLTLIAVSTEAGTDAQSLPINNDLTEDDDYPYYDYADPCPNNCSDLGNLKIDTNISLNLNFVRVV